MKTCKKCNTAKPLERFEYSYSSVNPENRRSVCKDCRNGKRKTYDSRFGYGLRESILKRYYNMTPQDYLDMSNKQSNKCYICGEVNKFGPWREKLVVDHCHKTGKVRKLLCDKCNKGLGQFNDNPELMEKAIKYLKEHS